YDEFENENQVFLNSNFGKADDENQLIKCEDGSCELTKSEATSDKPEYYFNSGDSDTSGDYRGDVIECIANEDNKVTCDSITSNEGSVYINANYDNDKNENQLIIFSELGKEETFIDDNTGQLIVCDENGCKPKSTGASTDSNEYYLSGEEIIKCEVIDGEKICKKVVPIPTIDDWVFIDSSNPNQIIYCDATTISGGSVDSDENPQYFVNTGNKNSNKMKDCLNCSSGATKGNNEIYINAGKDEGTSSDNTSSKKVTCIVKKSEEVQEGLYLNSNYSETGDINQMIKCTEEDGCTGITMTEGIDTEYHINGESTGLENAIIACTNTKWYYLNNGYNKLSYPLIQCDSSEGCNPVEAEIGYYVNAGNSQNL
ncbi:hypothetical protein H8356DRAFT_1089926, partial [Neocallimastix lanati (nom. inval.)]